MQGTLKGPYETNETKNMLILAIKENTFLSQKIVLKTVQPWHINIKICCSLLFTQAHSWSFLNLAICLRTPENANFDFQRSGIPMVAMTTRHMNEQSILLLNHVKQSLFYNYAEK